MMGLRKAKGNTYPDLDWLWSPLVGGCQHRCSYCYAAKMLHRFNNVSLSGVDIDNMPSPKDLIDDIWKEKPHWDSYYNKNGRFPKLPEGKIFVCDTTDLVANNISDTWVENIIEHCLYYADTSSFVFQTKNPQRLYMFDYLFKQFPNDSLTFGITLETNRDTSQISQAPSPYDRMIAFRDFIAKTQYESFVTIEPIMEFDLDEFAGWFQQFTPDLVWIGADSKKCNLPEPTAKEVKWLIRELKNITVVRIKNNLDRLLSTESEGE